MNFLNVMNKHGYIFAIQVGALDPIVLLNNECTIYPTLEAMYAAKCALLNMEPDEVDGCEYYVKSVEDSTFMYDDGVPYMLTICELDWLVEMGECSKPTCLEEVIAFYQM